MRRRPRRFVKKVNKNEAKSRRRQDEGDTGDQLEHQLPGVQALSLNMTFIGSQDQLVREDRVDFSGDDEVLLSVECPGRCGGQGAYDLAPLLSGAAEGRHPAAEQELACAAERFGFAGTPCGFRLKVEASLSFDPDA